MKIKLFRRAVAFSFWHYFGKPHGTAISYFWLKKGLFGFRLNQENGGLQIGFWWGIEFQLNAVHVNQFEA